MKTFILSGGFGKRLRPITDYVPKSLVPINNIPIIEWQIRYFKKFGVRNFVICTGYKNDQIKNYLEIKNNLGVKIDYSIEKVPLGTGGALKKAMTLTKDPNFFVINGDVITDIDLRKLTLRPNCVATVPLRTSFGLVNIENNKITNFLEKSILNDHWINAGVYFLSRNIIKYLPNNGNIENTTFPSLAKKGKLFSSKFKEAFWFSIDSHKDIENCSRQMKVVNYEKYLKK